MMSFGICMAILNSSIVGLAGILPPKYMSAFMFGISLNSVGPIVLRVITLASFGLLDRVKYFYGALLFFSANGVFLAFCAYGAFVVIRQNVIIFNLAQMLDEGLKNFNHEVVDDLYFEDRVINKLIDANNTQSFNEAVYEGVQVKNQMGSIADVWKTYKTIWVEASTVFLVYVCTMICFPGLILQTKLTFIDNESWF